MRKKRDKKKLGLIWAAIIALLMVTSIFGYIGRDSEETSSTEYNGYQFFESEKGWIVRIGETGYVLDHFPTELEDIEAEAIDISSEKVYVVFDDQEVSPSQDYASQKIRSFLGSFGVRTVYACLDEDNCFDDTWPLVECDGEFPIIQINKDNRTIIFIKDNCIVLQGSDEDLSKVADRLIYYWLGVMQ